MGVDTESQRTPPLDVQRLPFSVRKSRRVRGRGRGISFRDEESLLPGCRWCQVVLPFFKAANDCLSCDVRSRNGRFGSLLTEALFTMATELQEDLETDLARCLRLKGYLIAHEPNQGRGGGG